jgi:phage terminase small subunit
MIRDPTKKDLKMANAKNKLTPKQEKFSLVYVETGNASEAYRQAYDVGPDTKPETVWREASEALANGSVAVRVMELQSAAAERTLVTVDGLTKELEVSRLLAQSEKQPAAMTSATMGKAKLHGLGVENSKVGMGFSAEFTELMGRAAAKTSKIGD